MKKKLRQQMRAYCRAHENNPEDINRLYTNLREFLARQPKGIWASYRALSTEVPVDAVTGKVHNLSWVYPRVEGQDLQFYGCPTGKFETGRFQIEEPAADPVQNKELHHIQGALVPGLAFDVHGTRLGQGHGYYDRALANWNGIKVGIAMSYQIVAEVPAETHDVKMDYVVTPVGVIHCRALAGAAAERLL